MKKLSELMTMTNDLSSPETKPVVILFDGVLDAGKLLHCQEIDTFANHFFGKPISTILGTDHNEELHDWLRDELYKANVQGRSMVYPIKARFEDLAHDTHSDEYSAPLYLFLFDTDEIKNLLVITCHWYDGLFRNDSYVVGVIASEETILGLVENKFQQ